MFGSAAARGGPGFHVILLEAIFKGLQGIGKTDAVAQEFFLVHAQVSGAGGKGFFIWDQERFVGALEAEKLADDVVSAQVVGASEIVDSGREGECGFQMAYHFPHVGNAAIVVDGVGDAAFFTDSLSYAGDKGVVFPGAKLFIVKHPAHAKHHGIGLGSKASLFGLLLLFAVNAAGGEEFVLSVRFLYVISEVYLIRAEKNHPRSSFPAGQGYVFRAGYVYQIRVSGIFVTCAYVRNSAAVYDNLRPDLSDNSQAFFFVGKIKLCTPCSCDFMPVFPGGNNPCGGKAACSCYKYFHVFLLHISDSPVI